MADQRKITLRQGHATPSTIILRELPVATVSTGTRIYLYTGHATPKNIILRDPTIAYYTPPPSGDDFRVIRAQWFGH